MFPPKRPRISILIFVIVLISNINGWVFGDSQPRRLREMIKNDIVRHTGMVERAKWRSTLPPVSRRLMVDPEVEPPVGDRPEPLKSIINGSVKLPMYAAAEYEMGMYMVDINIGTPPRQVRLVVDTGSDLTWVKCKNEPQGRFPEHDNVFDVSQSSTYEPFNCSSSLCANDFTVYSSLDDCPTPSAPCLYNYSYGDNGLTTFGMFGKDSTTLPTTEGNNVTLSDLLIGCSESYTGDARLKEADGVLGLGISAFSFSLQAVTKFGGTFSYCLVDHLAPTNVTNYLIFGEDKEKAPTNEYMRYTGLLLDTMSSYYWVGVKGVSIDNKMLDIPANVWTRESEGGTILDSGTAATYWATPAYRAIMDVLIPALEKEYPRRSDSGNGRLDFEYCFNANATTFNKAIVPRVEIHFFDGSRFKPLVKSYIVDDSPGVKCIGFLEGFAGMNIIGNIMQQNYLWEFDLQHNTIGFVPSTCS